MVLDSVKRVSNFSEPQMEEDKDAARYSLAKCGVLKNDEENNGAVLYWLKGFHTA